MNPCFVTSDDICKNLCIVIWILFKQQLSTFDASVSKWKPSSIDLSHFHIIWEWYELLVMRCKQNWLFDSCIGINYFFTLATTLTHVAVLDRQEWGASSVEINQYLNLLNQWITEEKDNIQNRSSKISLHHIPRKQQFLILYATLTFYKPDLF
jgi:hypothetical protein